MKTAITLVTLAALLLGPQVTLAADAAATPVSDPEMKQIYDADQADRAGGLTKIDWNVVDPRDIERRQKTRALLAAGRLHTGDDFLEAAFVFQHGRDDDFLLAHTLAVVATKKGAPGGSWIAAATLDRYLQSIGHKQIYGTQTGVRDNVVSKEPYDRDLISDALRGELGVKDLATQDKELAKAKEKLQSAPTPPVPQSDASIRCDDTTIDRIFVRATWKVRSCGNDALMVTESGSPAIILVSIAGDKVVVTRQGGTDEAEIKVATAAFQAMTPAQFADIVAQTKQ